jgi:hypothetical protein
MVPTLVKPSAKQESKEQQEFADFYDITKELVKFSPHRIFNWDIGNQYSQEQEIAERSECSTSAQYIVDLFVGQKDAFSCFKPLVSKHLDKNYPNSISNSEFYGTFSNLLKMNQEEYVHEIAKSLFIHPKKPEHLLFYFVMEWGGHVFVIEKISNSNDTKWIIYQSWATLYTLAEWLGIDPWHYDSEFEKKLHNEFGNGAKLNKDGLLSFIKSMSSLSSETEPNAVYYIKKFEIDSGRSKYLSELLVSKQSKSKAQIHANKS